jgi:hypothetical protein
MLLPMIKDDQIFFRTYHSALDQHSFHLFALEWSELGATRVMTMLRLAKYFLQTTTFLHSPHLIFSFTWFSSPFHIQCTLEHGYHGKAGESEWSQKTGALSILVRRLGFLLRGMCNPSIGPW